MGFSLHLVALSALIVGAFALPAPEAAPDAVPDFVLNENVTATLGKAPNYNQNYIASGASVTYSHSVSAGTFSVNYNTKSDFVVGLGWQPGDTT
jgi:hypothetical protein